VIGSPSQTKGKNTNFFISFHQTPVDKSPSATMPCDLVSETGRKNNLEINKTWIIN
jgi:hypothetical protein